MPDAPIACTLSAAELGERGVAWSELTSRWGRGSTLGPDSVVLSFARDPGALARLERLVDQERECCAWIDYAVEGTAVTLTASGAGEEVLAGMFKP